MFMIKPLLNVPFPNYSQSRGGCPSAGGKNGEIEPVRQQRFGRIVFDAVEMDANDVGVSAIEVHGYETE